MIDFHTHILPNLDDGARSIEEAHNLLKEAEKAGFDSVVYTPHFIEEYYETNVKEREVWLETFSRKFYDLDNIKTYLGSEIFLTNNIMNLLENAKASTINNTSYVLFELPMESEPEDLYEILYQLKRNKVVPILAHPERYPYIQKEPDIIYELIQEGVYMQSDYGSVIGENGNRAKRIINKMLENNLVHFLGTNAHRENTIYKKIPQILEILNGYIGEEKLYELTTKNPDLALHNKKINIREPIEIKLTLKEKVLMFFNR